MRSFLDRLLRHLFGLMPERVRKEVVHVPVLQGALLQGRKALITGGTTGIGFAIAKRFLSHGCRVVITGRSLDRLKLAKEKLGSRDVQLLVLDNLKSVEFSQTIASIGSFDILVNNAGYVGGCDFGETTSSEYDKVMNTNLRGAYLLSQIVAANWIREKIHGNILNVCSASSLRPGVSPYILSKWGLRALTIGMAKKLVGYGIVVNGIAPGCTDTIKFSKDGDVSSKRNPSGRLVTAEEIANLSAVLVSSLCRMVVGDILYVTGGSAVITFDA